MIGKLFLFALVGVAIAQEYALEEAIRTGLERAERLNKNGVGRIQGALEEVSFKSKLIETKTANYLKKSTLTQDGVRKGLRNLAQALEEKANEINAPQSVFDCIKRVEEKANNEVQSFTEKFQDDMQRLERTKLANIKTDAKPLNEKTNALEVRYQRAVSQVKACKNERFIGTVINSFSNWLNTMYADINRILGQVTTIYTNFQRDANTFLNNSNRQISRVRSTASRNLRQCLYSREDIFGEN